MRRVRRDDRGATLVEYALVLALFVVASVTVAQFVEDETSDEVDNQALCLSERPPPTTCQLAAIDAPGGGAAGHGGPDGGGGVPTPAPASVTSKAPTVTDAGPLFDVSFPVSLEDGNGALEGEVVTAQVTVTQPEGSPRTGQFFYVDCTTDSAGSCVFEFDSRWPEVEQVSVDVVSAGIDTTYQFEDFTAVTVDRSPTPAE